MRSARSSERIRRMSLLCGDVLTAPTTPLDGFRGGVLPRCVGHD
jgi:hypothetical protein